MSVQWIRGDNEVVDYNAELGLVTVLNATTAEVVEVPRPPTVAELDMARRLSVQPGDAEYDETPREIAFVKIQQALLVLRQVTQDRVVTREEMQGALRLCEPAILSLRDVPLMDEELIHMTVLLISQVLFGYFYVTAAGGEGIQLLVNQFYALRQDLGKLQKEFAQYKAAHP